MIETKTINVNQFREILRKEFESDSCYIEGVDIVLEGDSLSNPSYIKIGAGRILNIYFDLRTS